MTAFANDAVRPRPRRRPAGQMDALDRIDSHEELCALRWKLILGRMDRIERIMIGAAGLLITTMGGLIATLLLKGSP